MRISDEGGGTGPVEHMAISVLLGVLAAHVIAGRSQLMVTTSKNIKDIRHEEVSKSLRLAN